MQYKLKRYSDALYPRKYPALGSVHISPIHGRGSITNFDAVKEKTDIGQQKFWIYTVSYTKEDGSIVEEKIKLNAKQEAIVVFPSQDLLPKYFPLAPFREGFREQLADQRGAIQSIFANLNLEKSHQVDLEWWQKYFDSVLKELPSEYPTFALPKPHMTPLLRPIVAPIQVDDGVRDVDVVQHRHFTSSHRRRALQNADAHIISAGKMEKLKQGMFVVVDMVPENSVWYTWKFLVAELAFDLAGLDTTSADTSIKVQVYRPCGNLLSLSKKFVKWRGDDNCLFQPEIQRGCISAIVEMNKQQTLTKKSRSLISSMYSLHS